MGIQYLENGLYIKTSQRFVQRAGDVEKTSRYSDVIMGRWRLKLPASRLLT